MRGPLKIFLKNSQLKGKSHLKSFELNTNASQACFYSLYLYKSYQHNIGQTTLEACIIGIQHLPLLALQYIGPKPFC